MKPVDDQESTERRPPAALLTLLKTVDPESLLPYTAVREIEGMAAERVLEAVEALRAETLGEIKTLRAETLGEIKTLRAETVGQFKTLRTEIQGEIKTFRTEIQGELKTFRTEIQGEIKTLRAETQGELKALGGTYKQMLWILIGFLVTTLTSGVVALYVQVFGS